MHAVMTVTAKEQAVTLALVMITLLYMQPSCKTALNSTLVCCRLLPFNAEKAVVPDVRILPTIHQCSSCQNLVALGAVSTYPVAIAIPRMTNGRSMPNMPHYRNWILKSTQCTLIAVHISVIIITQPLVWLERGNCLFILGTTQNKYLEGR